MSSELERRIRERAYQLWEKSGRPEGQQDAHWHEAMREIEAEQRSAIPSTGPEAVQAEAEIAAEVQDRKQRATRRSARKTDTDSTQVEAAATGTEAATAKPKRRRTTSPSL